MPKFMRNINTVSRCAAIFRAEKLTELGPCHHGYIIAICKNPGILQDRLAKELCVNKSNVTRSLAALEELGYVERRQSEEDKRAILVYPTERALAILPSVRAVIREWNEYLTEGLDEGELEQFAATLARITERARKYYEEKEKI